MAEHAPFGTIAWRDLTVADASSLRSFYEKVVGWTSAPVSMGNYDDYNMMPTGSSEPVAGICHARGTNANLPPQWLMYILVKDLDVSLEACRSEGGEIVAGPTDMGEMGRYAVVSDPAGAAVALFCPPE